ncbi:hypothetical protein QAD02_023819 [Eretmocerus hayati]|uniref:Uncharacterized protein n=1 Tax=Eretmocerus hayati TaxID=131215 RepID=A0ACC2PZC0_9HYME|nr:hypothetical protein QAD02_023819 [Eretmocerus hayati]
MKPIWKQEKLWMLKIFAAESWVAIILVLSVLSILGFLFGKLEPRKENYTPNNNVNLNDHILYTIALAAQQGLIDERNKDNLTQTPCTRDVPSSFVERSRNIYIITTLFSFFVIVAFNAVAIYSMVEKSMYLPFQDLRTLLQKSDYTLMTQAGSWTQKELESEINKFIKSKSDEWRVVYTESTKEVYDTVCSRTRKHVAAFLASDRYQADVEDICDLVRAPVTYFETWISSAFKRGYHARDFNIGFIKMYETGLFDGLKEHWLGRHTFDTRDSDFQSVEISQIVLLIYIFVGGLILSGLVLAMEVISFYSQKFLC